MKRRILIIEDNASLVQVMTQALSSAGYEVASALNGNTGLDRARAHSWDLLLVNWSVPGLANENLIRKLRSEVAVPLMIISSRATSADKIEGLRSGADDYLVKPVDTGELLARIEAHLRRSTVSVSAPVRWLDTTKPEVAFGDFVLRFRDGQLYCQGEPVLLSHQEFRLLCLLADHPHEVLSTDRILSEAWGYESVVTSRTVYVHVAWLRKKLRGLHQPDGFISTVRGIGYIFRP